jgi:DNA-binding LytR/AlgR family response regulator
MKLKCLLLDEDSISIQLLQSYIKHNDALEIEAMCSDAFSAICVLRQKKIDVIFLDIRIPGLFSTDFFDNISKPQQLIFTTAYKEYALDGFNLNAVDYLIKPISLERFLKAIKKLKGIPTMDCKYFKVGSKMINVKLEDILFIESQRDYVKIVRSNDNSLIVKQTTNSVSELLPKELFIRIHRSFIVAINKISAYTHQHVEIMGNTLPIGRKYGDVVVTLGRNTSIF